MGYSDAQEGGQYGDTAPSCYRMAMAELSKEKTTRDKVSMEL